MTARNVDLGGRLRQVRDSFGVSQPAMAEKCGVSGRAYQDYEAGKRLPGGDVLQALADAGVDLNWLLTGAGSMLRKPPAAAPPDERADLDRQMEEVRAALAGEDCPVSPERLRERPDLDRMRQDLLLAARDPALSDERRAQADLLLNIAFGDQAATERSEARLLDIGKQLRDARKIIDDAATVVDWSPPPAIWHALHTIVFRHQIASEDVILLLDAMKSALRPGDHGGGHSPSRG